MINLGSLVDRAVCITTPDRWPGGYNTVSRQFSARNIGVDPIMNTVGLNDIPDWYSGRSIFRSDPPDTFKGRPGSWHHMTSFRDEVYRSNVLHYRSLLILEDDCILTDQFDAALAAADLPDDWECLYLGGQHDGGINERLSPHLLRLWGGTLASHAVLYRSTIFNALLDLPLDRPIDCGLADVIQQRGHTYSLWPSVAVQVPGMSQITGEMGGFPFLFARSGVPGESS